MNATRTATTRDLATFLTRLRDEALPEEAVERTKELFLHWLGSVLAGRDERPIRALERFSREMGPSEGPSEDLTSRHGLTADQIARVRARAHGAAIDVLGPVSDPRNVHQSKFSMGFVLALAVDQGSLRGHTVYSSQGIRPYLSIET